MNEIGEKKRTVHAEMTEISERLGIPMGVLRWRRANGMPYDAPYRSRQTREEAMEQADSRRAARVNGKTRYEGSVCTVCNGTTRYTANGGCCACAIRRNNAREKAIRALYKNLTGGNE